MPHLSSTRRAEIDSGSGLRVITRVKVTIRIAMHRHWMAITFTRALAHVPRRLLCGVLCKKYTVQQFRRGMLLQLINIVLCTLSLIFNNTYFLVALVFTCNTWWLLRWRRYCGLLFLLLSYPLAMYATVSHNVFSRPSRCSWAERLLSHLFCDHASAVSI